MTWRRKNGKKGSSMAEAAITLPVVVLLTFAMVNLAMAWYAAVAASNAANYGARLGSVAQSNPIGTAVSAAQGRLDTISVGDVRDKRERGRVSGRAGKYCGGLGSAKLYRKSDNLHRRRRSDELCRHCPFYVPSGGLVIKKFLKDRKGYAMPYTVMLITLVAMPTLILASEIVRALYVGVHIQTAVDAACTAAVQAVDVPHFIATGELMIDSNEAASFAQRDFDSTVSQSDIENYNPALTAVSVVNNTIVECHASAAMKWTMPGVAPLTFNVSSAAEAQARR